jgi:hypothetical protein
MVSWLKWNQIHLVAVPRSDQDSAFSGIALSEPSISDDWLNPDEEEAWAHL